MKRYLLFDSSCSKCSNIAHEAEKISNGWFEARSLRDSEMQDLLRASGKKWHWRPMLLEVDTTLRIHVGFAMSWHITRNLGLAKVLRIANLLVSANATENDDSTNTARRQFLRQAGLGFAAFAFLSGIPKLDVLKATAKEDEDNILTADTNPEGAEIYEGFLILPENAAMPASIKSGRGIDLHGESYGNPDLAGSTEEYETIDDLKTHVSFPIYAPQNLPLSMQFSGATLFRYVTSGEIWAVILSFSTGNPSDGQIAVWARPEFHRPFPIWQLPIPFEVEEGTIPLEKIDFTPSAGLMQPSAMGHMLQWIKHEIHYALIVEVNAGRDAAVAVGSSLTEA